MRDIELIVELAERVELLEKRVNQLEEERECEMKKKSEARKIISGVMGALESYVASVGPKNAKVNMPKKRKK